jgi:glutamate formiminotransferase
MMIENPVFEEQYVRIVIARQLEKRIQNDLPPGTPVYLYNDTKTFEKRRRTTLPGIWIVKEKQGMKYVVMSKNETPQIVQRWMLKEVV